MRQRGSILIYTILVLIAITTISLALLKLFIPKFKVASESVSSVVAISVADSVMEWCLYSNRNGGVSTIPLSGQVAWWKFDEISGLTAADSSGNSNTGNLINGPIWTVGHINNGLQFDGVDDHVNTNKSIGTIIGSIDSGTVSWWQNPSTFYNSGAVRGIWGDTDWPFTKEFSAQVFSDNNWYVGWNSGAGDTRVIIAASAANYVKGSWNFYTFTWVNGGNSILYQNGVQIGINSGNTSVLSGTTNFDLGVQGTYGVNNSLNFFPGSLDEFHIYNRVLTQAEITQLFNYTGVSSSGPPQPTISISTTAFPVTYQIYRGTNPSVCPSGETPLDYRTVGNYRGISRSLEIQ